MIVWEPASDLSRLHALCRQAELKNSNPKLGPPSLGTMGAFSELPLKRFRLSGG